MSRTFRPARSALRRRDEWSAMELITYFQNSEHHRISDNFVNRVMQHVRTPTEARQVFVDQLEQLPDEMLIYTLVAFERTTPIDRRGMARYLADEIWNVLTNPQNQGDHAVAEMKRTLRKPIHSCPTVDMLLGRIDGHQGNPVDLSANVARDPLSLGIITPDSRLGQPQADLNDLSSGSQPVVQPQQPPQPLPVPSPQQQAQPQPPPPPQPIHGEHNSILLQDRANDDVVRRFMSTYAVVGIEGAGGFSKVIRARVIPRDVAIKEVPLIRAERSEDEYNRLLREPRLLETMYHPNIIMMYRCEILHKGEPNREILAMELEYCAGGDLARIIKAAIRQPAIIPETDIKLWFKQIFSAVKYLHDDKKIVHRDIKPENILFKDAEHRQIKLGDFGLAKQFYEVPTFSTAGGGLNTGTAPYMSPECFGDNGVPIDDTEDRNYGRDIWALGVTLFRTAMRAYPYECPLMPFHIPDIGRYLANISQGRRTPWIAVQSYDNEAIINLIDGMLVASRDARSNISQIVDHPWLQN